MVRNYAPEPAEGFDIPPEVPDEFDPPEVFAPTRREGIETMFDGMMASKNGVSGLYLEASNRMTVDERSLGGHHNTIFNQLMEDRELKGEERIIPWAMSWVGHRERFEVDLPNSAGGLFQAMSRWDMDDVFTRVSSGRLVETPLPLYAAAYTLRLLDSNPNTFVNYQWVPAKADASQEVIDAVESGEMIFNVEREVYRLGDLYQELRFVGLLPDPVAERPPL